MEEQCEFHSHVNSKYYT